MMTVLRVALLFGVSAAAGAGWMRWRHPDLPWIEDAAKVSEQLSAVEQLKQELSISVDELRELIEQGAAVLDAREPGDFEDAHLDIEQMGSPLGIPVLNVPPSAVEDNIARLEELKGFADTFVLYCNSQTCTLSAELAYELLQVGFFKDQLRLYEPGWVGIEQHKLPVASGPDDWAGLAGGEIGDQMGASADPGEEP